MPCCPYLACPFPRALERSEFGHLDAKHLPLLAVTLHKHNLPLKEKVSHHSCAFATHDAPASGEYRILIS